MWFKRIKINECKTQNVFKNLGLYLTSSVVWFNDFPFNMKVVNNINALTEVLLNIFSIHLTVMHLPILFRDGKIYNQCFLSSTRNVV